MNSYLKESKYLNIMTSCEINTFEELLTIATNKMEKLKSVNFTDEFYKNIEFRLKLEGKTFENIKINGHITSDIFAIFDGLQNLIYNIYANCVKDKKDARSLTEEEKKMLTLVFQIKPGSTEAITENISTILNSIKSMKPATLIIIATTITVVSAGYFIYKSNESNNEIKKFLVQNETINYAIQALKETTIKALHGSKLDIDKSTFGDGKIITKQEIQEMYNDIKNCEESLIPINKDVNLVVKKLYKKGNGIKKKNMATLYNDNIELEAEIVENLFENNEKLFFDSYSKEIFINCNITEYENNGNIVKAILNSVKPTSTSFPSYHQK